MIVKTLGRFSDMRQSIIDDSKYLIGVYQEPATPLPCREHHDPPDTPPPTHSSSSSSRQEFATPTKPAPSSSSSSSGLNGAHMRHSSSSSSLLMKPPSHGAPHIAPQRNSGPPSSRPATGVGLHKAPGPGPGGGYHSSSSSSSSSGSSSSSYSSSSSSSSQRQGGPPAGRPGNGQLLPGQGLRPHQPPKLSLSQSLPTITSDRPTPDINDILKEMKASVFTPLTAIAATPRKEHPSDQFDFDAATAQLQQRHPHQPPKRVPSSSTLGLMDDLNISDSDDQDEGDVSSPIITAAPVLSPLPEPPLISVPSPLEPLDSPLHSSASHHHPQAVLATSEVESDDESSSGSEESSSESSSEEPEPEAKIGLTPPKVLQSYK